jgi:hypothetical protein
MKGRIEYIVSDEEVEKGGEDGLCEYGVESTVVDGLRSPPVILRPGGITVEMIRRVDGFESVEVYRREMDDGREEQVPTTPGMKYRHYSPIAHVIIVPSLSEEGEFGRRIEKDAQEHAYKKIGIFKWTNDEAMNQRQTWVADGWQVWYQVGKNEFCRHLFHALR